jgi:hypothetical protein
VAEVRDRRELEELRTRVANQAASLAEAVTDGFDDFHMGAGDYRVELSVPEGPSTGGGTQALQHLRLVPRRKGYAIVMVGTVNPVTSTGEIRTYEHVALQHELRFDKPLEITPEEYDDFLKKCDVVLNLARIKATRVPAPPELVAQKKARQKISMPFLVLFVLVMLLAGLVVYKIAQVTGGGH